MKINQCWYSSNQIQSMINSMFELSWFIISKMIVMIESITTSYYYIMLFSMIIILPSSLLFVFLLLSIISNIVAEAEYNRLSDMVLLMWRSAAGWLLSANDVILISSHNHSSDVNVSVSRSLALEGEEHLSRLEKLGTSRATRAFRA